LLSDPLRRSLQFASFCCALGCASLDQQSHDCRFGHKLAEQL
jgi:hypothetical protein